MLGDEHDTAFTVAKMMDTDLLKTVQDKLTEALNNGSTLADFKRDLIPTLQKAGWWGEKDLLDPVTGDIISAQLGSASRLETIFRSNIQSAYSVGHWDKIRQSARTAPFLMYDAVDDGRTRPEHAARNGQVHPVNSEFWKTHFPPNGYNCRCGVIQLDADDVKDMGLTVEKSAQFKTYQWKNPRTGAVVDVPEGVDPGWDHNPGKARQKNLEEIADQKAGQLLQDQAQAVRRALRNGKAVSDRYRRELDLSSLSDNLQGVMKTLITNETIERAPWTGTRPVAIIANEQTTKKNPHYPAAKQDGDVLAAVALALELLDNGAARRKISRLIGNKDPLVVAVHATEGMGVNLIPQAMAEFFAAKHGLRTTQDIIQTNRVGHTGSDGYHRLANPALFTGDVVAGSEYLLVDDFIGQGGTLANLRGHIELKGGKVLGAVAMTGQRRSAILAPKPETLKALRDKHEALESWWTDVFGYGFDLLTESEARYLLRSPDVNTIRANVTAAARQGN